MRSRRKTEPNRPFIMPIGITRSPGSMWISSRENRCSVPLTNMNRAPVGQVSPNPLNRTISSSRRITAGFPHEPKSEANMGTPTWAMSLTTVPADRIALLSELRRSSLCSRERSGKRGIWEIFESLQIMSNPVPGTNNSCSQFTNGGYSIVDAPSYLIQDPVTEWICWLGS